MNIKLVRVLFAVAALYDGILGLVFLFDPGLAFRIYDIVPPNHFGYVQFPAILLLVFAAMFLRIARDPVTNRFMIWYGVALKAAYSGTVFYYMSTSGVPAMWVPWAWADLVFLALFIASWYSVGTAAVRND